MLNNTRWHYFSDDAAMNSTAAQRLVTYANHCIAQKKNFSIVLAGGNTPKNLYRLLCGAKTDWSCWHIYFGDERCLPPNDANRNSSMAQTAWLSHVTIPSAHIHIIPAELSANEAVQRYTQTLHKVEQFDLVLLGMGEDGHTASLFPAHDWGEHRSDPPVLAVDDAPFFPSQRISLSAYRLSQTQQLWFLISGEKKKPALYRWKNGERLPVSAINPANGVDVFIGE